MLTTPEVVLPSSSKPTSVRSLPGPIALLKTIVRTHGVRGLWLGQTGTLIRETGGAAAWFGTKEAACNYILRRREKAHGSLTPLTKRDLTALESATAGALAGISYNAVLFPADTVKSAMQTEEELSGAAMKGVNGGAKRTFFGVAKEMYAKGGVKGLYAGCGITVARSIPSSALIFLIYDGLAKRFG
jgi:ornithine carrier protein